MKRGGYDRHLHNKTSQDLMRLVVEGTSCNGEVIRRNNLQLEGETTFSLKAKRFSGEEDRREFKMQAKRPRVMHVTMKSETTLALAK